MHERKAAGEYRRGHEAATTGVAEADAVGDADNADGETLADGPLEDAALEVAAPDDGPPDDGLLDDAAPDEEPEPADVDGVDEQPASSAQPVSTSTAAVARPRTVTTSRG